MTDDAIGKAFADLHEALDDLADELHTGLMQVTQAINEFGQLLDDLGYLLPPRRDEP